MVQTFLLCAALLPVAQPGPRYAMGCIIPSETESRKIAKQGVSFEDFAKGFKSLLPPRVDLSPRFPPPHPAGQGEVGSCVGWSFGYAAKSFLEAKERGWRADAEQRQYSPSYIYNMRPSKPEYGMHPLQAVEILKESGCATYAEMPYEESEDGKAPTSKVEADALPFQILDFMAVAAPDSEAIKMLLASEIPVVLSTMVDDSFMQIDGPQVFRHFDHTRIEGGHAMCAVGYDDELRAIRLINSWSNEWGDRGYCWVSYDLFDTEVPYDQRFVPVAYGVLDAPTVVFRVRVEPADEDGARSLWKWTVAAEGPAPSLQQVAYVSYSLPSGYQPRKVIRYYDEDPALTLSSLDVEPSATATPLTIGVRLTTQFYAQTERRPLVVPCGDAAPIETETTAGRVTIPNVCGLAAGIAALRLRAAGLAARINRVRGQSPPAGVASGNVARQSPAASTQAQKGSSVVLYVYD